MILVNYKGAQDTAACLSSLYISNIVLRIVVVDNTPNDPDLPDVMANFPDVHLIYASENLGFGRGNNLGIDWALANIDCEFIFILNNDAMVEADTMQRLEWAMDAHPDAGILAPRIVLAEDPNVLWYGGGEVDWRRGGGIVPGVLGASTAPLAMQSRCITFASGCAMLIRRELLEKIGGFDDRYFMYEEDLELGLRAQKAGYSIWYEPLALVRHVGQGSMRKGGAFVGVWSPANPRLPFYVYHIVRNRLLTVHLHARSIQRLKFAIGFPVLILIKLMQFIRHRRWDGVRAVFRGWVAYRQLRHAGSQRVVAR